MNLITYRENGITHIIYMMPLESSHDVNRFYKAIKSNKVELTFIDVEIVSQNIVEAIIENKDHLKIKVISTYLSRYFTELKIYHEFVRVKDRKFKKFALNDIDDLHIAKIVKIAMRHGYNLTGYKYESIKKSVLIAINRKRFKSIDAFIKEMQINEVFFSKILNYVYINVSSFFRDPQVFKYIKESITDKLAVYPRIKIWCAGSSIGMEPYTVAMVLSEANLLDRVDIYATDVNANNLVFAENGLYSEAAITKGSENYLLYGGKRVFRDYFSYNDHYYKVNDELKSHIHFFQHDLVTGASLNEFELVLCRNVLIYFNNELKDQVLRLIAESLHPNGYLVLGKNERIYNLKSEIHFSAMNKSMAVYKRGY